MKFSSCDVVDFVGRYAARYRKKATATESFPKTVCAGKRTLPLSKPWLHIEKRTDIARKYKVGFFRKSLQIKVARFLDRTFWSRKTSSRITLAIIVHGRFSDVKKIEKEKGNGVDLYNDPQPLFFPVPRSKFGIRRAWKSTGMGVRRWSRRTTRFTSIARVINHFESVESRAEVQPFVLRRSRSCRHCWPISIEPAMTRIQTQRTLADAKLTWEPNRAE